MNSIHITGLFNDRIYVPGFSTLGQRAQQPLKVQKQSRSTLPGIQN